MVGGDGVEWEAEGRFRLPLKTQTAALSGTSNHNT